MDTFEVIQNGNAVGPYSPAVVAAGRFVFISGQGAIQGGTYHPGTVEEETRMALENVRELLAAVGSALESITHCRIFLSNIDDFAKFNGVYASIFSPPYPARTTIQAGALPLGVKVEIECVALVPDA